MIDGYRRRRAWAAFHAGYGTTGAVKDPEFSHLLGKARKPVAQVMSDDAMAQNIRRWRIATTRKTAND